MPEAIFLAGPNGAGKSTLLPNLPLDPRIELVLADELARGYRTEGMSDQLSNIRAGRNTVRRLDQLEANRMSFLHETNLAGPHSLRRFRRLTSSGYRIRLSFVGLRSPETAVARVAKRVCDGGHDVPEETIRKRWAAGVVLFMRRCQPIVDEWALYDNEDSMILVARGDPHIAEVSHYALWREYSRLAVGLEGRRA